ncbi:Protein-lysine N-methyltransferase EFM3 [Pseudozyma hubeiensis]|nr:Protein-lysine N-methyltransferase EFM3 [Pseudozyma hubeiensis]
MASGSSGPSVVAAGSTPDAEFTTHSWPMQAASMLATGADDEDVDLLKNHLSVTIREEGTAISKGTTGLRTWEAGLRLAAHLTSDPSVVTAPGTRILELGSGTGFVGSVCATQQMSFSSRDVHTFMTDMPGQVSARLRDTLHLNGLDAASGIVVVRELDWLELVAERQQSQQRDDLPTISFIAEARPTLILAADVVYDPDLIEPLVEAIRACLQAGTAACKALVASTIRNPKTYDSFKASLESFGLKAKVVDLQRPKVSAHEPLALSVFPSVHDLTLDGPVELLCITLV